MRLTELPVLIAPNCQAQMVILLLWSWNTTSYSLSPSQELGFPWPSCTVSLCQVRPTWLDGFSPHYEKTVVFLTLPSAHIAKIKEGWRWRNKSRSASSKDEEKDMTKSRRCTTYGDEQSFFQNCNPPMTHDNDGCTLTSRVLNLAHGKQMFMPALHQDLLCLSKAMSLPNLSFLTSHWILYFIPSLFSLATYTFSVKILAVGSGKGRSVLLFPCAWTSLCCLL